MDLYMYWGQGGGGTHTYTSKSCNKKPPLLNNSIRLDLEFSECQPYKNNVQIDIFKDLN